MGVHRIFAAVFAVVFLLVGILGFVPAVVMEGKLLGIFEVDTVHNIIHLVSGLLAGWAAMSGSAMYAKLYFQVFGVVYGLVTVLGFAMSGDLWIIHVNPADNYLHLAIALVSLIIGFGVQEESKA